MSYSLLWHIFFYGWFASEILIAVVTRTGSGGGKVSDRGTMYLLWIVIFSSITAATWISEARGSNLPNGAEWMRPAALFVLIFGVVLRLFAVFSLGKAFSANVAIRDSQTVMKTGLYRWMRHPSYTGLLLCFLAIGLHSRNWISLLIMGVFPTAALLYRIHVEEITLRGHFGQEYVEYSRRTKRLIPGIY